MNLPNKISLIRIALIPFMIFFYLADFIPNGWGKLVAFIIFVIAALTDFLDGYIARKYNMTTSLGKFLDPIADKILMTAALLLVICDGTVPVPYGALVGIIIFVREFIVSVFRQMAANKNIVIAADIWGKIKTFVLDISLPALILLAFFNANGFLNATTFIFVFEIINYVLLGIGTALTFISGVNYVVKNWKVMK